MQAGQRARKRQWRAWLGDTWTWIAMDSDTKLIPCFHVGKRDATDAYKFISDLARHPGNGSRYH